MFRNGHEPIRRPVMQPGGEPIPGYRLERRLGAGEFGEVWVATVPSPGRRLRVALKFSSLTTVHGYKEYRGIVRVMSLRNVLFVPMYGVWLLDERHGPGRGRSGASGSRIPGTT